MVIEPCEASDYLLDGRHKEPSCGADDGSLKVFGEAARMDLSPADRAEVVERLVTDPSEAEIGDPVDLSAPSYKVPGLRFAAVGMTQFRA